MIETDSPYCEIRNSHVSKQHVKTSFQAKDKKKYDNQCLVKGRNEPCTIRYIMLTSSYIVYQVLLHGTDVWNMNLQVW